MPIATPPGELAVILPEFAMLPETVLPAMTAIPLAIAPSLTSMLPLLVTPPPIVAGVTTLFPSVPAAMPILFFAPLTVIAPELATAPETEPVTKIPAMVPPLAPLALIVPALAMLPMMVL
jgi:hypothetical protein